MRVCLSCVPARHYNFRPTKLYNFIINHAIKTKNGNNSAFVCIYLYVCVSVNVKEVAYRRVHLFLCAHCGWVCTHVRLCSRRESVLGNTH